MTTALVVVAFVAAYVLIATERIHRTAAALIGAAAMVLLGAANAETAFFSEETGVDWNVIFLLLGMMVIVSIVRRTGVFEYLAIWSAKKARGRPFVLMVMLVVLTAVASALLDNVTTVLLVAPVTMLVCERLDVPAAPYLIAEVMASNIGGTATLIGDPPNIIIASRADLSFNDFLVNLAPIVVMLMVVFIGLSWLLWGRSLPTHPERVEAVMRLDEKEAIRDHRLLAKSFVVLGAVLIAFVLHSALHVEPAIVALLGAGVLVAWSRLDPPEYLEEVEWPTLVFFMGLFVMVGALVEVGVIDDLATTMTEAVGDNYLAAGTRPDLGVRGAVGRRGQHPLRRDRESPGLRPGGCRWRLGPGAVAVVGARARRRPRRERHRCRGQRQRRRPRRGRAQRPPDLVLAVHPLRPRGGDGDDRGRLVLLRAALLRPGLSRDSGMLRIPRTRSTLAPWTSPPSKRSSASSTATSAPSTSRSGRRSGTAWPRTYGRGTAPRRWASRCTTTPARPSWSSCRTNLGPGVVTMHVANHPEIEVDGDSATGTWAFEDTVIVPDFKVSIRGAGYYHDTYRRDADGAWRIASTEYERVYEAMTSLEDTPSFKLIANRWDPELRH